VHNLWRRRVERHQCDCGLICRAAADLSPRWRSKRVNPGEKSADASHLGNGEYDLFRRMSEPVVVASAIMTPQNVAQEAERLIYQALYHRRPVYMAFPADLANQPLLAEAERLPQPRSAPESLDRVVRIVLGQTGRTGSPRGGPGRVDWLKCRKRRAASRTMERSWPGYVSWLSTTIMTPRMPWACSLRQWAPSSRLPTMGRPGSLRSRRSGLMFCCSISACLPWTVMKRIAVDRRMACGVGDVAGLPDHHVRLEFQVIPRTTTGVARDA
jgi:hypothetical protein